MADVEMQDAAAGGEAAPTTKVKAAKAPGTDTPDNKKKFEVKKVCIRNSV